MIPFLIKMIELALGNPIIRGFFEGLTLKVFAEIIYGSPTDPKFTDNFHTLGGQLASADTPEKKQNVLRQIMALRNPRALPKPGVVQPLPPGPAPHA